MMCDDVSMYRHDFVMIVGMAVFMIAYDCWRK
jgi:hypothetical protein